MALAATVLVGATGAYFTSQVTAANNQITTGTLSLAFDSSRTHFRATPFAWNSGFGPFGAPYDSYTVAYDNNGVNVNSSTFEPWTNAAPGLYVPYDTVANGGNGADNLPTGNKSIWVAVRNNGTVDMKVRASATGSWTSLPRTATDPACTGLTPDPTLVSVKNVTIYGTTGGSNICKGNEECENIYYGLTGIVGGGWTYATSANIAGSDVNFTPAAGTAYLTTNGTAGGTVIPLKSHEFVIARVDLNLSETANNCYQGATYQYNLVGNASQTNDPAW